MSIVCESDRGLAYCEGFSVQTILNGLINECLLSYNGEIALYQQQHIEKKEEEKEINSIKNMRKYKKPSAPSCTEDASV